MSRNQVNPGQDTGRREDSNPDIGMLSPKPTNVESINKQQLDHEISELLGDNINAYKAVEMTKVSPGGGDRGSSLFNINPLQDQGKFKQRTVDLTNSDRELALRQNIFDRRETTLDKEAKFYYEDYKNSQFKTAAENKKRYMQNYGIQFEIPSIFVQDSKIYPTNPSYYIQLIKYSMPSLNEYQYIKVNLDNTLVMCEQAHLNEHKGLLLRLLKKEMATIKLVDEVELDTGQALMSFSEDGTLFGYYLFKSQSIKVMQIDPKNPERLIKDIKQAQNIGSGFVTEFDGKEKSGDGILGFLSNLNFDQNNRYLIGHGDLSVLILDLKSGEGKVHQLHDKKYQKICHINFKSKAQNDYECCIGCLVYNMKQIQVFDLMKSLNIGFDDPPSVMKLNFDQPVSDDIIVSISDDFSKIIMGNGIESLMLEKTEGQLVQSRLKQTKGRTIKHIQFDSTSQTFYLLLSKEYDKFLYLENSHRSDMDIRYPKSVEPQIISIFDMHITHLPNKSSGAQKMQIKFVSLSDGDFSQDEVSYLDKVQIKDDLEWKIKDTITPKSQTSEQKIEYEQEDIEYFSNSYIPIRAFSTNWPYVTFQGLKNTLMLFNAFDRKYLRIIELAREQEDMTILESIITDTNDLIFVVQKDDQYFVYMIDLDSSNIKEFHGKQYSLRKRFKFELIVNYSQADVGSEQLTQVYARGSSRKEKQDNNTKLVILLHHGKNIYSSTKLKDNQDPLTKLQFVDTMEAHWNIKDNNEIMYLHNTYDEDSQIIEQEIKSIYMGYSTCDVRSIYKETNQGEKIQAFNYDQETHQVIIQCKRYIFTSAGQKKIFLFRIYDPQKDQVVYSDTISNRALIGRLKGGLYTFVNGHIYYNNNVIKLRYDLINNEKSNDFYHEKQIFDYYFDIFPLDGNDRVKANTPLDSMKSKRFCYIILDTSMNKPNRVMFLPYLHDKRIFLNRIKDHTEYFYTSVETKQQDEDNYHKFLYRNLVGDIEDQEEDVKDVINLDLNLDAQSQSGEKLDKPLLLSEAVSEFTEQILQKSFQYKCTQDKKESFTSIVCMNITSGTIYIYSQGGFLFNRIVYHDFEAKYGKTISVSNNGRLYIFKKDWKQLEALRKKGYSEDQLKQEYMTVYLVHLSIFQLTFVKKINILEEIKKFALKDSNFDYQSAGWALNWDYTNTISKLQMKLVLNNNMDICIRIRSKEDLESDSTQIRTLYYLERFNHKKLKSLSLEKMDFVESHLTNLVKDLSQQVSACNSNAFSTAEPREADYTMNKKKLFVWSTNSVKHIDLDQKLVQSNFKTLSLTLDPEDKDSYIKDVRTGSDPSHIVVIVEQEGNLDTIFKWNLEQDMESEVYDIQEGFEIIWDKCGSPYIISDGKVVFVNQRTSSNAFDIKESDLELQFDNEDSDVSYHKGHRFDANNHNWLIFQQSLQLPFSYMTFVIKDKIESNDELNLDNVFDPVPYNYIFYKSTAFIDGDFIFADHVLLEEVLHYFEELNPGLLQSLHYTQDIIVEDESKTLLQSLNFSQSADKQKKKKTMKKYSALHKAFDSGNNRSVDLILASMAKIPENCSRYFKDILHELVDFKNFRIYINELPCQTIQMESKQILKIESAQSDKIVNMGPAHCIYVDEKYYKDFMGEDKTNVDYSSYPVNVVGLRLGWVLNDVEGKLLLQKIAANEDMSIFETPTLEMMVEFIYKQIRRVICFTILPIYLLTNIFFEGQIIHNDHYNQLVIDSNKVHHDYCLADNVRNPDTAHHTFEEVAHNLIDSPEERLLYTFNTIVIILQCVQLSQMGITIYYMGMPYFKRYYSLIDTMFVICNIYVCSSIINKCTFIGAYTMDEFETEIITERIVIVLCYLFLYQKFTYFLSLVDEFAPLVNMVMQILLDIRAFTLVVLIYVYQFSKMFSVMGQNQVQFDCKAEEDVPYVGGFYWAFKYGLGIAYGASDESAFLDVSTTTEIILEIIYLAALFMLLIHLLNMIIAIMGESFGARSEIQHQMTIKQHLEFVVDNWFLMFLAFRDRKRIRYIMTAFFMEEESDDHQMLQDLKTLVKNQTESMQQKFSKMLSDTKEVGQTISKIMNHLKTYTKSPSKKKQNEIKNSRNVATRQQLKLK